MTDATRPTAREVEQRVLEYIRSELVAADLEIEPGDDLLSGRLLDSMAVLRLATFVDEEYRVGMRPADFVIENFQNIGLIARFVIRRSRGSQGMTESEAE
jgi:acyl carrier protein